LHGSTSVRRLAGLPADSRDRVVDVGHLSALAGVRLGRLYRGAHLALEPAVGGQGAEPHPQLAKGELLVAVGEVDAVERERALDCVLVIDEGADEGYEFPESPSLSVFPI
jgi:hypothetical protein